MIDTPGFNVNGTSANVDLHCEGCLWDSDDGIM